VGESVAGGVYSTPNYSMPMCSLLMECGSVWGWAIETAGSREREKLVGFARIQLSSR
jgi:hypothetical protein